MSSATSEFIESCYRVLLRREPDPTGLEEHLKTGNGFARTLENFVTSAEFGMGLRRFSQRYCRDAPLLLDQTQNGEFQHILHWLIKNGSRHQLIVDVGANSRKGSNSYDLMKHFGWKALLIEANPALIPGIKSDFAGLPFDLIQTAIGTSEGTIDLVLGVNPDISSIDEKSVAGWGPIHGRTEVSLRRLPTILAKFDVPQDFDILTVDIEGVDVAVFNDLMTSDYRPRFVILEIPKASEIKDLADRKFSATVIKDYHIFGNCGPNLFLERSVR